VSHQPAGYLPAVVIGYEPGGRTGTAGRGCCATGGCSTPPLLYLVSHVFGFQAIIRLGSPFGVSVLAGLA
jgi:hypothetical protein